MESVRVMRDFLDALERGDTGTAVALVDDEIAYTNVSLPTLHGRDRVESALRGLARVVNFHVYFHNVAAAERDEGVVLTERTDGLVVGRFHCQFWVYGRFEVRGGKITVWRDSFDWGDVAVGMLRGAVGTVMPRFRRQWPTG
jgi:limonene-1,2-epoxide hydrolase